MPTTNACREYCGWQSKKPLSEIACPTVVPNARFRLFCQMPAAVTAVYASAGADAYTTVTEMRLFTVDHLRAVRKRVNKTGCDAIENGADHGGKRPTGECVLHGIGYFAGIGAEFMKRPGTLEL